MATTLYLLRQQPDRISSSLFRAGDPEMDVVFVEQAASTVPSTMRGVIVATAEMAVSPTHPTISYDDLVEKILSSERIIVL